MIGWRTLNRTRVTTEKDARRLRVQNPVLWLADGKTGIDAIERLREKFGTNIPAFLISGDTAPDRLREAAQGGFQLLYKPVQPMRPRAMLNQLLRIRPFPVLVAE